MNTIQLSKCAVYLAAFCVSFAVFAQSNTGSSPLAVLGTVGNPLGYGFRPLAKVTDKQGRIVLYRGSSSAPGVASVFINGGSQSSLVQGGCSRVCLSPVQINGTAMLGQVSEELAQSVDSMFAFGKSDLQPMLPEGQPAPKPISIATNRIVGWL